MNSRPSAGLHDHENPQPEYEYPDNTAPRTKQTKRFKRLLIDLLGRWYWIAFGTIIGLLCSAYYLSKAPKRYSATTTLLIKTEIATIISRDQVEDIDMRTAEGMATVAERIRRHDLLERVASRMDVRSLSGLMPPGIDWRPDWFVDLMGGAKTPDTAASQPPPAPPALAGMVGSWMDISIRRGTRLMDISFTHEVPEVAKALADAVAREYLAEIAGSLVEGRSSRSETLMRQSEDTRIKLQAAESALASYNRALDLHNSLESQENSVAQLSRRYLPKHPRMIAATQDLEMLKVRFLDEFAIAISSSTDEAYWKTSSAQLEKVRDDPEARLRLARQLLLARTGVLRSETSSLMSVFNAMLTRIEESNVNREGEETSADISSLARVPGGPNYPVPKEIYTDGATFGAGFGLAIALLLIRLSNRFGSVSEVEALTGQPVLGAIADIKISHLDHAFSNYRKKSWEAEPDPLQEGWDPLLLFRPGVTATNYAEMFRILRASVSLLGDESKRKVTLFSSALPGEGKSIVSTNFALAGAGQSRRTLLIDLDLRKPSLHRVLGISRSEIGLGITEWLAGQVSFDGALTRNVGAGENLHVMFAGKQAPNPGELLNVEKLKVLFEEACRRYDLVVIDSAPLLAVPDTRIIAPLCDNFCLVVRADYVPKGAVMRTLELLEGAGSPPSGLILNGFSESRRMMGENYSYGSYQMTRYGRPYKYGYGTYGSYGAYGSEEEKTDGEIAKRKRRSRIQHGGSPK